MKEEDEFVRTREANDYVQSTEASSVSRRKRRRALQARAAMSTAGNAPRTIVVENEQSSNRGRLYRRSAGKTHRVGVSKEIFK